MDLGESNCGGVWIFLEPHIGSPLSFLSIQRRKRQHHCSKRAVNEDTGSMVYLEGLGRGNEGHPS